MFQVLTLVVLAARSTFKRGLDKPTENTMSGFGIVFWEGKYLFIYFRFANILKPYPIGI